MSLSPIRRGPFSASLDTLPNPCQAKEPRQLLAPGLAGARSVSVLFNPAQPPLPEIISTSERVRIDGTRQLSDDTPTRAAVTGKSQEAARALLGLQLVVGSFTLYTAQSPQRERVYIRRSVILTELKPCSRAISPDMDGRATPCQVVL
jgi:hypothetical protein